MWATSLTIAVRPPPLAPKSAGRKGIATLNNPRERKSPHLYGLVLVAVAPASRDTIDKMGILYYYVGSFCPRVSVCRAARREKRHSDPSDPDLERAWQLGYTLVARCQRRRPP